MPRYTLTSRSPIPWAAMLKFFRQRELPGVESISETHYRRGSTVVTTHEGSKALLVDGPDDPEVRSRLRAMFDLDADRDSISAHLNLSPVFLPGAWCAFELAVRAILGQQVSVAAARTLAGRLRDRTAWEPAAIATCDLSGLGILPSRCRTLKALAQAAQNSGFRYCPEQLLPVPGIGPWTAQYIAMRAARDPDAFPAGDLILRRAAVPGKTLTERQLLDQAERWRPYRAYAAIHLWISQ